MEVAEVAFQAAVEEEEVFPVVAAVSAAAAREGVGDHETSRIPQPTP